MQLKNCARKGCRLDETKIMEIESENLKTTIDQLSITNKFQDVVPDEIP